MGYRRSGGNIGSDVFGMIGDRVESVVHAGPSESRTLLGVVRSFGLSDDEAVYKEVDAETAKAILTRILHRDLAYGSERMSSQHAEELARALVGRFPPCSTTYWTNGNWNQPPIETAPGVFAGPSWTPATDATFDAGIVFMGQQSSALVWLEDED